MNRLKQISILVLGLLPTTTFAQEASATTASFIETYFVEITMTILVVICIVVLLAMYSILTALRTLANAEKVKALKAEGIEIAEVQKESFWSKFWANINAAVPIEREAEVATSHEYDGIKELDNRLPPWWLYGFYATIVFGIIYMFNFYFLSMPTQDEEFHAEMTKAKEDVELYLASLDNLIDERNVVFAEAEADILAGKQIFEEKCAVCHANDGGGGVGPNLTDRYWLHGGDMPSIFATIKYGVPSKGMISWEAQLSPKKMQQVSSYIYTLEGTVPASAKEPQGEFFKRVEPESAPTEDKDEDGNEVAMNN